MSRGQCQPVECSERRRSGVISTLLQLIVVYVALVFGGGTMIRSGHPVAVELGRLIHTVTLIEPAIGWAESNGYQTISHGLRTVSRGMDFGHAA